MPASRRSLTVGLRAGCRHVSAGGSSAVQGGDVDALVSPVTDDPGTFISPLTHQLA
jgi:hypothetical protein